MKIIAAVIASLLLSIVTFSFGVFGTILYLSAPEPGSLPGATGVSDLWTAEPTIVARKKPGLERVAAVQVIDVQSELSSPSKTTDDMTGGDRASVNSELDGFVTSSIEDKEVQTEMILSREHMQWCMSKYASYRTDDDAYQPYNGERRRCISPYIQVGEDLFDEKEGALLNVPLISSH
jgi:hypothetical protein